MKFSDCLIDDSLGPSDWYKNFGILYLVLAAYSVCLNSTSIICLIVKWTPQVEHLFGLVYSFFCSCVCSEYVLFLGVLILFLLLFFFIKISNVFPTFCCVRSNKYCIYVIKIFQLEKKP